MQKLARSDQSEFLNTILAVTDYDEEGHRSWSPPTINPIEMEVIVPVETKKDGVYIAGKKVLDLKKDEKDELDLVSTEKKTENDSLIDYFYDSLDDWKEGTEKVDDVPVTIEIDDYHSEPINTGNPNDNASEVVPNDYKVYYSNSNIDITKILDKSQIEKIDDKISIYLNEELDWD